MNKYTLVKNTLITIIALAIISGYTYIGITSGIWLAEFCAVIMWMGIGVSIISYAFVWLGKKEKESI